MGNANKIRFTDLPEGAPASWVRSKVRSRVKPDLLCSCVLRLSAHLLRPGSLPSVRLTSAGPRHTRDNTVVCKTCFTFYKHNYSFIPLSYKGSLALVDVNQSSSTLNLLNSDLLSGFNRFRKSFTGTVSFRTREFISYD